MSSNVSDAGGAIAITAAARASVTAVPVWISCSSHASSPGGAPRPSCSLSSRFRCRKTRS